jgi:prolyl oligopeptidase
LAFSALGDPNHSSSRELALAILDNKEKIPHITKIGELYYNFWQDEVNVRGLLRRTTLMSFKSADPKWETVLDFDQLGALEGESWVYKGHTLFKPDSGAPSRTLMKLSRGGADATVVREFDLVKKQFLLPEDGGFCLEEAKSIVSYKDLDTLYVGTDMKDGNSMTDSGYPRAVREWKRGTPLADSKVVMECDAKDMLISGYVSKHRGFKYPLVCINNTFYTNTYFLKLPMGAWVQLSKPDHAEISQFTDKFLITLRKDWVLSGNGKSAASATYKSGSLLAVDVAALLKDKENAAFSVLFEPTDRRSLEGVTVTANYVVLDILDNVRSKTIFWKHTTEAGWTKKSEEENAAIRGISLRAVDEDVGDYLWMNTESYIKSGNLSLINAVEGAAAIEKAKPLKKLPAQFDASDLEEVQFEVTSEDGTVIPYFMISKKGMQLNGQNPTLLYGYGGFEISMTPGYAALVGKLWMERGGVYVVANIRGGGEFGPRWHQAALKANRKLAYDDFIAVGEDLIRRKITSSKHLGIRGGSNGGLLMGNMYTRRPDLWGAVVCQVPLLDMRRYSHLLAGASWMAEYGNPDVEEDWAYLQRYSAYHNISTQPKYPPMLMMTSTRDDRVHPYHARCFVKRMLDVQKAQGVARESVFYFENIEGGHGGAADNKQAATNNALIYDFLWKQLAPK